MKHVLEAAKAAVVLACLALISAHTGPARAQDFSNKPIRIIVGLVAGGATDVTPRLIAQKLTDSLHTNVYVENRPGAAFEPALRELTGAPPDGHTLFMISASVVVTQPFHKDYPFDLAKMTPITDRVRLQIRLEAFNLFNSPMYDERQYNQTTTSNDFGRINRNSTGQNNFQRFIQLGFRVIF